MKLSPGNMHAQADTFSPPGRGSGVSGLLAIAIETHPALQASLLRGDGIGNPN